MSSTLNNTVATIDVGETAITTTALKKMTWT